MEGTTSFCLDFAESHSPVSKPVIGGGILHLQAEDSRVFGAFHVAKPRQNILFSVGEFSVDDDNCGGAVIFGVYSFGNDPLVRRMAVLRGFCR